MSASGHVMIALASGIPKTKHIIAKQVTLTSNELAIDLEILEEEMQFNYFGRCEWLCYGAYLIK